VSSEPALAAGLRINFNAACSIFRPEMKRQAADGLARKFNSPLDAHILGVAEGQRESGLPVRLRLQGGFEEIEAFVNQLVRGC